jgi:hypothetical protein
MISISISLFLYIPLALSLPLSPFLSLSPFISLSLFVLIFILAKKSGPEVLLFDDESASLPTKVSV